MTPTGSFKDRGASRDAVLAAGAGRRRSVGRQLRQRRSGDGGYAAAGGIAGNDPRPCRTTAPDKTVQMRAYGAEIRAHPWLAAGPATPPMREAATIFLRQSQLAPVLPAGNEDAGLRIVGGSGLSARRQRHHPDRRGQQRHGLRYRLRRASPPRRDRKPGPGCSPRSRRIARRSTRASWPAPLISRQSRSLPTIAEGASIAQPVRTREVLAAVRRSGGATVAVSEVDIERALFELSRIGLYVEPTSAIAGAAFTKLLERGVIHPTETTVLVLTGAGLQATRRIGELIGALPTR